MRDACEPLLTLRAEEAVSIRNDSNTTHIANALSMPTGGLTITTGRLLRVEGVAAID